jgi:ribonucleoside-diphosphate reductase beta chain
MTERKSPTAVLREGPRALSDAQVREIEDSSLEQVLNVDIDDVIEYVHKDLRSLPDFTTLYRKYLKQRWDVYDLDFSQDKIDWQEKMTEEERQSFIAVASGFHHGERQVEIELPVFMIGASEEEKLHIAAQIEDEARHTVFFDRFYREVVGLKGDDIMDILDASFPWVSETFVAPFGLLAYQADELRLHPYDERARVRYGTNYFLWIEGVLALSVMKVTLSYARWRGFLPAYYTGFTATCRDESRHVQGGMRYLQDAVRKDPTMIKEIPRHAADHPVGLRGGQPADLLRAAGLDRRRGAGAVLPAAPAQAERRRHRALARPRGPAAEGAAGAGGRVSHG